MASSRPIKRNEHIMPLSREHHMGLLFCWKLRQGVKREIAPDRIRKYINYFWDTHLKQHFEEEENILFNQVKHKFCDEAIVQHQQITDMIQRINTAGKEVPGIYTSLAALIDQHIRFEERELFPYLESALSAKSLSNIGIQLKNMHAVTPVDNYQDEFWVKV
ncbi:hemerythrin domain-containing protein [Chitinophaga sp. MM2321]|uniref:hemerythrin domain-containing protein n=1 Tax=Chitinophaga sp. MM2321 TaxID=3137178 RepID=UPI0032D5A005